MRKIIVLLLAAGVAAAAGCHRKKSVAQQPALRVETTKAVVDTLAVPLSFIGYLSSNFDAVIQPRVNGYLLAKRYEDGMPVRKGQPLFTIDPAQLSTTAQAAEAQLQSARAQAVEARNNYERAVPLARINAISQAQLDQYTAQHEATQAAVRSAEQALRNARLEVGYTQINAPIDGVIAYTQAHVGDYVGPGTQFEVLTTISNLDTLTVDLSIPMTQYLRHAAGRSSIYDNAGLLSDIRLTLADGSAYPYPGLYRYTRKNVSQSTGSIVLVVAFPNPGSRLKAGQFARIAANIGSPEPRVLVPQRCVDQAQGVSSLWIVRPDSTVEYRQVTPGDTYGDMWCIESGLAPGERVLVTGRQKMHAGMKVIPE